jgi:hypothetical protein
MLELDAGDCIHPRGDGKYAQSNEGTGDRGVKWSIRRRKEDANREIGVPRNVAHVTADAEEIYPPPLPLFFISVDSRGG